ncbi:MAG TPA: type II restriction endonuclease, partial [Bacteroidales bacterium]|nr:type II restriction endonuclease [Bacteroidales bacterium]
GRGLDLSKVLEDKSKKSVNVKGLIDILKSYYFTVEENTPYDQEVSLDPELLGKVFENLLASYNPETKSSARKQSGSFYTPREIVQYMVDESLIAYLKNNLGERIENDIRKILSYSDIDLELSDEEKKDIISSLYNCKILDPACGSGAFPMGVLQQIVHIIKVLDNDNKYWYELVKKQASFESEEAFNSTEKEKEELLREIGHNFDLNINSADYSRKLYVIENSIYGVDIQPLAVQISKLRFFISLVIEQKSNQDASNNFNIRPLPNLEAKFVAANTLIGIDRKKSQIELFDTKELEDLQNKLKSNRHKIFTSKSPKTKKERKEKDIELRNELANLLESYGSLDSKTAKLLAEWDMFDQNVTSSFFDTEWMFGINNGFDIVIGNPPYIQLQDNHGKLAEMYKNQNFSTFARTGDIYSLFYEQGINLLKEKGVLTLITSNKWMRAGYGEKLREFFYKLNPIKLIDLGSGVFENATVDTNILIVKKEKYSNSLLATSIKTKKKDLSNLEFLHTEVKDSEIWTILNPIELSIKKKIESVGTPLKDWDIKINYGIKTGCNEAFIINGEKKEEILANCQTEEERKRTDELIRPILRGRDIKRYSYEFADLWIIATFPAKHINLEEYPAVKQYLLDFGIERLEQTGQTHVINGEVIKSRKKTNNKWFEIQDSIGYWEEFSKQKIVYSEIVREPQFYLDNEGKYFPEATTFIMTGENLESLIILLHSKIVTYIFQKFYAGGGLGDEGYRYKKAFLENLPIPKDINIEQDNEEYIANIYGLSKEELFYIINSF